MIKPTVKIRLSEEEINLFKLPERYPASEVAKEVQISGTTNVIDHIDLSLTPYHKTPLDLVGVSNIETLGMLGGTQCGKSVFLQLVVADTILQDPGTLIYCFPDEASAKKAIEDKIINMVKRTPKMYQKVSSPKSRNLNVSLMRFIDMIIQPAWGGSLATLSGTPAKRGILDEVRLMPLTIGEESNPIELMRERLATFLAKGIGQLFLVSTPAVEGDLLHQQLDKPFTLVMYWYSRCQSCHKYQILDFFKNIKWTDKLATDAQCKCQFCGEPFDDSDQKRGYSKDGIYGVAGQDGLGRIEDPISVIEKSEAKHVYFWFSALDSPFRSFKRIAQKYIEVKDKIHDYRNFVQSWLGKFWKQFSSKIDNEKLLERRVDLPRGVVPTWCKVITAGADTQDNGFYITFRAHGDGRKTHLLDAVFVPSDVHSSSVKSIADTLRLEVEERIFTSVDGKKWQVGSWSFDTAGHRESEMAEVVKYLSRATRIKGRNTGMGAPIQASTNVYGLWFARTHDYLEATENECLKSYWTLFSEVDEDYLTQFMNAQRIIEENKKTGEKKIKWGKVGQTDYRMAEIHNFITLDLPFSSSTIRRNLESDWTFNPYDMSRKVKTVDDSVNGNTYQSDFNDTFYDDASDYTMSYL